MAVLLLVILRTAVSGKIVFVFRLQTLTRDGFQPFCNHFMLLWQSPYLIAGNES